MSNQHHPHEDEEEFVVSYVKIFILVIVLASIAGIIFYLTAEDTQFIDEVIIGEENEIKNNINENTQSISYPPRSVTGRVLELTDDSIKINANGRNEKFDYGYIIIDPTIRRGSTVRIDIEDNEVKEITVIE